METSISGTIRPPVHPSTQGLKCVSTARSNALRANSWVFLRSAVALILDSDCPENQAIVTNSSDTVGWRAMVRSKSALVAPIPTAIAAI